MTIRSRLLLVLAVAAIVGGAFYFLRFPAAPVDGGTTVAAGGGAQTSRQGNPVGDVRLESLDRQDDSPDRQDDATSTPSRDVFRFGQRRAAVVVPPQPTPRVPVEPVLQAPTGPPPPPPIPLRYIGYLDQVGEVPRVAVLSDGRGNVFNGKEGDVIEGRYRVLRIGNDSADLIYIDGRGRQTIRLSGQ
jgi:hypothetical protein